ncbi:6-phosphogluconate dehydrogenase [Nucleospora cyclopteri]
MHHEFSETIDKVNLTLFKSPKTQPKYEIKQIDQTIEVYEGKDLCQTFELYAPARIIAIHNDDYKLSIVLHKKEEQKWHTITGPIQTDKKINEEEIVNKTIDNNIHKPVKKDLWGMLEEIYFNGDDDTKKAMIKSFRESEGKILSSDWGTVKCKTFKDTNTKKPK